MKKIRFVQKKDIKEILEIYKFYIKNTAITFEYEIPTLEEFEKRVESIKKEYPYIVCEENNKIVGYAYAHRHMKRAAYQWNAELSVYLSNSYLSKGLGKELYEKLIKILELQNIHNVYACITLPNIKSVKLHEYFGFKKVGIYPNAGYKLGKWHDVIWYEKNIKEYQTNPTAFLSIKSIEKNKLLNFLN